MSTFKYLPYLIPFAIVIFIFVIVLIRFAAGFSLLFVSFRRTKDNIIIKLLLLIVRGFAYSIFLGVDVVYKDITLQSGWWYFTNWNIYIMSLYYGIGVIHLLLQLILTIDPNADKYFETVLTMLYSSCGATAFMITVVDFIALDSNFDFWNVFQHFLTTIFILVEMMLNSSQVHFAHYTYCVLWIYTYIIFAWSIVGAGIRAYPYFFLQTDTTICFVYYPGLVLVDFIAFLLWWGLHQLKWRYICACRLDGDAVQDDGRGVQMNARGGMLV